MAHARRFPGRAALALCAILITASAVFAPGGAAASAAGPPGPPGRSCQTVTIPVAPGPGAAAGEQLSAQYCTPAGERPGRIDVLVGGATYSSLYWDWPQDPALYSYVDKTLAAGRATLAIDRLGTGSSSKPPAGEITDTVSAYTVHQAIAWVRARGYRQVDLVGHSLGSMIATLVAAEWPGDVSRLVLTGLLNETGSDIAVAERDLVPVGADPAQAGYVTTAPGTRGTLFYAPGADPSVIAYDETRKDQVSLTELATGLEMTADPASSAEITAPVLLMVGQEDFLYCEGSGVIDCDDPAALLAHEAPYFAGAASLTVETIPGTGHDLALSPTAPLSFSLINAWINGR